MRTKPLALLLNVDLFVFAQLAQVHRDALVQDGVELLALHPVQVPLHELLDLVGRVHLGPIQVALEVVELVGVGLVGQNRGAVVVREGLGDGIRVVQEVEHEDIVLLLVRPVEPRQGLDRPNPREGLVDVHGVEEGFVVAGLELVRADEEAVRVLLEHLGDLARGESVQRCLAHTLPAVFLLTRERDDRLVGALALLQVVADGVVSTGSRARFRW